MFSSLNQRADLQANTLLADGGGGYSDAWQSVARVWVKITPRPPSETLVADRLEAKARHAITLRRRSDIAIGQRLVVGSRHFRIYGIEDEGPRAAFLTLACEELP